MTKANEEYARAGERASESSILAQRNTLAHDAHRESTCTNNRNAQRYAQRDRRHRNPRMTPPITRPSGCPPLHRIARPGRRSLDAWSMRQVLCSPHGRALDFWTYDRHRVVATSRFLKQPRKGTRKRHTDRPTPRVRLGGATFRGHPLPASLPVEFVIRSHPVSNVQRASGGRLLCVAHLPYRTPSF